MMVMMREVAIVTMHCNDSSDYDDDGSGGGGDQNMDVLQSAECRPFP